MSAYQNFIYKRQSLLLYLDRTIQKALIKPPGRLNQSPALLFILAGFVLFGKSLRLLERFDLLNSNVSPTIFTAAEAYFSLGYSVIPLLGDTHPDRPKVAAVAWSAYQESKPTLAQLRKWFVDDAFPALAIITGSISRLAVLDFDTAAAFRSFQARFPTLAETHVIQTRRGFHIYYRLPSNMRVPSRKGAGIDLLAEGCYVVARPSTIGGHTYKLVQGGQPRILALPDLHHILSFIDEQTSYQSPVASHQDKTLTLRLRQPSPSGRGTFTLPPEEEMLGMRVKTTENITLQTGSSSSAQSLALSTQHFSPAPSYRYYATSQGRNRALFFASLSARDHGWPLEQTLQTLVDLHINQRAPGTHPSESTEIRRLEAENTIRSAYSRPARRLKIRPKGQAKSNGLPNTVREKLFGGKNTHAVRLWETLNLKGIHPGTAFTAAQAVNALKGIVGRDSVYNALNLNISGTALFEGLSPSAHPQASNDAADGTKIEKPKKCVFGRAEKSGINQKGRKIRHFVMPAPLDWCRILGVEPAHSDPLTLDDLGSAKTTRMAAHRELIKRRPGKYPRRWLAHRLGVRVETIDTYNIEIPIQKMSQFSEKRIYWSNIRLVPDDMQINGAFLEDSSGKRYPAKRSIAAKLLAQGQSLTYKRQDANYYWYGDCPPDLGILYGVVPRAASKETPDRVGIQKFDPTSGELLKTPPENGDHRGNAPTNRFAVFRADEACLVPTKSDCVFVEAQPPLILAPDTHPKPEKSPPAKPKRLPSGRRPLKNADQEALACRVVERVNRMNADPALHIGVAVVRRLVSQYDRSLIDRTLALLETRRNIAKPAGFFITVLRSESKRSLLGGG